MEAEGVEGGLGGHLGEDLLDVDGGGGGGCGGKVQGPSVMPSDAFGYEN